MDGCVFSTFTLDLIIGFQFFCQLPFIVKLPIIFFGLIFCLLLPSILIQALSKQKHELHHCHVVILMHNLRKFSKVKSKYLITVEHVSLNLYKALKFHCNFFKTRPNTGAVAFWSSSITTAIIIHYIIYSCWWYSRISRCHFIRVLCKVWIHRMLSVVTIGIRVQQLHSIFKTLNWIIRATSFIFWLHKQVTCRIHPLVISIISILILSLL